MNKFDDDSAYGVIGRASVDDNVVGNYVSNDELMLTMLTILMVMQHVAYDEMMRIMMLKTMTIMLN